jgi:hypothetical protein
MDLEERISAAKELIARRDEIDRQLGELFGGGESARNKIAVRKCGRCGQEGHTARTCAVHNSPEEAANGHAQA